MEPTSDEIRRQLERLLSSDVLASSRRLSRFLRFVVERSLAGQGDRLKEYVIGVEVFDRDAGYDPRIDSIVRVEAGRLRAKLNEYYTVAGREDSVTIELRKGGYSPVFRRRRDVPHAAGTDHATPRGALPPSAAARRLRRGRAAAVASIALLGLAAAVWLAQPRPQRAAAQARIAVLPFTSVSADAARREHAVRLTDGVAAELVRAGGLGVVASTSTRRFGEARGSLRDVAQALDADLLMEATLLGSGGDLRVEVRIVDGLLDEKFWVGSFTGKPDALDELERRIAAAAASAVAARHP